jgi:hypothetical protein
MLQIKNLGYDRSDSRTLSRHGTGATIRPGYHAMQQKDEVKECPLCGESMRRKDMELVDVVPGTAEVKKRKMSEWVCPECEYFEEIEGPSRR